MSSTLPSIEDLLKKKPVKGPTDDLTVEDAFSDKMESIHLDEKEKQTETDAAMLGLSYVNLKGFPISPEALSMIPEAQARQQHVVCFFFNGSEVRIGSTHPDDPVVIELSYQLGERHKAHSIVYKISDNSLEKALALYASLPKVKTIVKGVQITDEELTKYRALVKNFSAVQNLLDTSSITDVIVIIMAAALELGSSDIHIEAEESGVAVRLRIDGILQDVAKLPTASWEKIISRIKLIAGLKINVNDRPQDGRFTIFLAKEEIDVRTSTLPTSYGESVVMRVLRSEGMRFDFEKLGLRPRVLEKLRAQIEKPHGMIITTGPTGSGKTTTLYAVLQKLNTEDVKIITLEDPVEYKMEGVNQSQIDHTKDYTFAKGLRSILRQDPDIVMVGEIRDLETAEIAIQAALTGHLMLSTIHTNDAAGAIPRFISMGVKPFLLAPALNAMIGQRLVRTIHADCKEEITLDTETLEKAKAVLATIPANSGEVVDMNKLVFYRGKGCDACNGSGFKGRVGIYELLLMDAEVEKAVLTGSVSEYQMRDIAKAQGMITMAQDGLLKALDGMTSVDEVFRVAE